MTLSTFDLIERLSALPKSLFDQVYARLTDGHELDHEELVRRSICHTLRYERGAGAQALAAALDDLYDASLRVGVVDYAATLWTFGRQVQGTLTAGHSIDGIKAGAILDKSGPDPIDPSSPTVLRAVMVGATALQSGRADVMDAAIANVGAARRTVPADSSLMSILVQVEHALSVRIGHSRGDYGVGQRLADTIRARATEAIDGQPADLELRITALMGDLSAASARGDLATAAELLEQVKRLTGELPADDPTLGYVRTLMDVAGERLAERRSAGSQTDGVAPPFVVPQRRSEPLPEEVLNKLYDGDRAVLWQAQSMNNVHHSLLEGDPDGIRRAIAELRRTLVLTDPGSPGRADHRGRLGILLLSLYCCTLDRSALTDATTELERAADEAGGPSHPYWATICLGLFRVHQLLGRDGDARTWGRRGLEGHAWRVLLQDGAADATTAAERGARDDAIEVSRAHLAAGDGDTAATTLDAGRGLLLHSATATTSIADRLRTAGATELAAEWERSPVEHAVDLRYRALTVLADEAGTTLRGSLLSPPSLAEVRAALGTIGADALVYLVPVDDHGPGLAVVVPRTDNTFHVRLPNLTAPPPVSRNGRDTDGPRGAVNVTTRDLATRRPFADITDVCDWAWSAAMGPLLDAVQGTSGPVRLVIVPFGELATVPWHAARSSDGRYALESAVISYAASARLLCEVAWRPAASYDRGGLIVADPTSDLPDARREAGAVGRTFYPAAQILGDRNAERPATPSAIVEWLRHGPERSTLHLACHGVVGRGGGNDTYLQLADGQRLTAQDILETGSRLPVDVVSLSACTTAVAAGSYDEAFSLSTAFLVAGARTVFGSLWPVPSATTSLLMFLAHHYLRADGLRPADALRRAQLRMLDPERMLPTTMPPELVEQERWTRAEEVHDWAGFIHLGH